ncbi:MAG: hypothetical protein ACM3ZB_09875 [bacterium]|jgi:inorganic triphosphatase YgiF
MQTRTFIGALFACAVLVGPLARAQEHARVEEQTQDLLRRGIVYSDRFERSLEQALKGSTYRGSHLANRLEDLAEYIDDHLDEAEEQYRKAGPYSAAPGRHVQNALVAAQGIDRAAIAEGFPQIVQDDWAALRDVLNRLAATWNFAPIPTGPPYVPAAQGPRLTVAETSVLLENIHEAAARFEHDFDRSSDSYQVTRDSDFYEDLAEAFKDATGRAARDFRKNDTRNFRINLQDTYVLAAALNRTMTQTRFSPTLEAQWSSLREDLNRLAVASGIPPLPAGYATAPLTE